MPGHLPGLAVKMYTNWLDTWQVTECSVFYRGEEYRGGAESPHEREETGPEGLQASCGSPSRLLSGISSMR